MAENRKMENTSNEYERVHIKEGLLATASNRSKLALGAVIVRQERETAEYDVPIVSDQLTVTLSNFPLVQLGHSGRIVSDIEPRCDQGCKQQHSLLKERDTDGRLKENSVPDDACLPRVHSDLSTAVLHNAEVRYAGEDQRLSENITSGELREKHSNVEYRMPLITKQGSLAGKRCEIVMKTLEELQDNGKFETHERLACNLLDFYTKNGDPDMVASLMIERGIAFFYANDLKKSIRLYKAVIRMGDELENRSLLQGRAFVQLAVVYRTEFGKAIECLKQAYQLLSNHEPGEDTSELCYYYGLKYLYLHWNSFSGEQGRHVLKTQAREYLERAIANCDRDKRPRVQLKKKRYCSLRLAALHLECGTRAARQTRRVTNEDIKEAKKHLDFVEYQLSEGIPLGTKIQLLKARTDQYYREGKFCMAKETAQHALGLAKRANMRLETIPLNERIEDANMLASLLPDVSPERFRDSGCSADADDTSSN